MISKNNLQLVIIIFLFYFNYLFNCDDNKLDGHLEKNILLIKIIYRKLK